MSDNSLHNELLLNWILSGNHDILELNLGLEFCHDIHLASRARRVVSLIVIGVYRMLAEIGSNIYGYFFVA